MAEKLRRAQTALAQGLPLAGERQTVGQYLARWLDESAWPTLRPRTFDSYRMICERHLIPALGRTRLVKLGPEAIQRYMNKKREAGLSARTVQYHHAVLRRALGQAERWGLVPRNAARLVSPRRVQRPEVRPLTPEQARNFLNAVRGDRLEALYVLAMATGMRQGELLGLSWEDVDLDAATLAVRATLQRHDGEYHRSEPKTQTSRRTLALPPAVTTALRPHHDRQDFERLRAGAGWTGNAWDLVFATEAGGPLYGTAITRRFQQALQVAGLPRQRFHDLRHAAATFMLSQGVPLKVTQTVLGHSQIAVTANTYSHVMPELQRDAAERVGALLWAES